MLHQPFPGLRTPPPGQARPARDLVAALASRGARPALLSATECVDYEQLARRVGRVARSLGPTRRLVLVRGRNTVDGLVDHLGALAGGHVVLLVPDTAAAVSAMQSAYDPDVVLRGEDVDERRTGTRHDLHPDLALLLSTSGSTGSQKLVRLSYDNLLSNAEAVAQSLALAADERAVTTLPMHYCYGLSVVHSTLLRGGALVLTELSVVEDAFWDLVHRHGATSLAGVPYTFDLLDRVGFADKELPRLRRVTQAGGRLAPDRVRRYAELGRRRGWDLYVMYGQTEATARMACLPPDLALTNPHAVGRAVPGGSLSLAPVEGAADGVGELVFTGPNVMLGYAASAADLGLGRTTSVLPTGDLARHLGDGLYEIVGRRSRFAKVFGLRIDLGRVEAALSAAGHEAVCVDAGDALAVALDGDGDRRAVRQAAAGASGLPTRAVRVLEGAVPRLPSGKPDLDAVRRRAAAGLTVPDGRHAEPGTCSALAALFAEVLDRDDVTPDSTFVELGGDSLSYVELSVRLEEQLGRLADRWHVTTLRDLAGRPAAPLRPGWRAVDTSVVLRAVAILAVVVGHAGLLGTRGGAHVLVAVAGFNVARFTLSRSTRRERSSATARTLVRVVVPSVTWIGGAAALGGVYRPENVLLVHAFFGPEQHGPTWAFWFLETLVWTVLALSVLLSVPVVDAARQRAPFIFAAALVGVGLLLRYQLLGLDSGPDRIHTPHLVFWVFALGWAAAVASRHRHRVLVSAVVLVAVPGFFVQDRRAVALVAGVLLLAWCRTVPVPALLVRPVGVLAAASLYVYVTHFVVYPQLASPAAGVLASLLVGLAYWRAWSAVLPPLERAVARCRPRRGADTLASR